MAFRSRLHVYMHTQGRRKNKAILSQPRVAGRKTKADERGGGEGLWRLDYCGSGNDAGTSGSAHWRRRAASGYNCTTGTTE